MDDQQRTALLEQLAREADRRREAFLADAGRQFARFVDANRSRLRELGGLVLIDEDPEYLSVTGDGRFISRTRYQDESGAWLGESEEIEDAAELVEIYNPADLFAAFADAARDEAGLEGDEADAADEADEADEADQADDGAQGPDEEPDETDEEPEADTDDDDDWIANMPAPRDKPHAARLLYDLALTFQERSQLDQAQLLDDFQDASAQVAEMLGDSKVVEDEDERIWFRASGAFEGEVRPEPDAESEAGPDVEPEWQPLTTPDDMVQFYDPTDLFGDLAEAIAESYPEVAPELGDEDGATTAEDDGGREQP